MKEEKLVYSKHAETLKEDWLRNDEWKICEGCGRLFDIYGDETGMRKTFPHCGKEIEE